MSISAQRHVVRLPRRAEATRFTWRRAALVGGAASTILYVGLDAVSALIHDGYSYRGQTISELSAVGAETRSLWIPLGLLYSVLVIAGAAGVWASAGQRRALRVVAILLGAVGVIGLVAWPFAPMHQREVLAAGGDTFADTMHLVLGGVDTALFLLMMGIGAATFGRRFRLYSIATIVAVLVFGALTGMESPKVADNESTPWIGITERIAVFGSMLWISVLALGLLRRGERGEE